MEDSVRSAVYDLSICMFQLRVVIYSRTPAFDMLRGHAHSRRARLGDE